MLMRNTSAPAWNSRAIIARSDEAGPSVATILVRRRRLIVRDFQVRERVADGRRAGVGDHRAAGLYGRARRLFAGFGELHRPGALLAGIDFEKSGAVETARKAILACRGW